MRVALFSATLLACALAALPALAQGQPTAPPPKLDNADQVVGLFGATCLHYAGDVAGMRKFITDQHAPQMPAAARDAFLAGRQGQVFDVSYQTIKLALVSLDDGSCEAVAEHADPTQLRTLLAQAAAESQVALQPLGGSGQPSGKEHPGVQQTAYGVNFAGHQMHILVSTEVPAPQAVLTLVPK